MPKTIFQYVLLPVTEHKAKSFVSAGMKVCAHKCAMQAQTHRNYSKSKIN